MKKQTILTLGICALAFGAVAGAVSAQRALETRANVTWVGIHYTKDGVEDWHTVDMTWSADDEGFVKEIEFEKNGAFTIVYYDTDNGSNGWCDNKYVESAATGWAVKGNDMTYSGEETKTFKVTAINPHKSDSNHWVNLKVAEVGGSVSSSSASTESSATSSSSSSASVAAAKFAVSDVYFTNSKGWDKVYAYAWDGEAKNAAWPGVELAKVDTNEFGQGIFKVTGLKDFTNVIFNNGLTGDDERKTVDIAAKDLTGDNNAFYADGDANPFAVGSWKYAPSEASSSSASTESSATSSSASSASVAAAKFAVSDVYFTNSKGWDKVYAYAWDGEAKNAAWPGVELAKVDTNEFGQGIFKVTGLKDFTNVIFNNGLTGDDERKTVDIAAKNLTGDNNAFYADGDANPFAVGSWKYAPSEASSSASTESSASSTSSDTSVAAEKFAVSDVYFTNSKGWDKVYAYAWDGEAKNADWPGVELAKVDTNEYGQGIFKVTGLKDFTNVIFNNGLSGDDERKTVDIAAKDLTGDNNAFYADGDANPFAVGSWKYAPKEETDPVYTCTVAGNPVTLVEVAPGEFDGATCVKKFRVTITATDGAVVVFSKDGTPIAPGADGNIALVEGALKITKGGAGISLELKVYEDGGFATWASEPADADLAAVREFVEKYIATPAAEDYNGIAEANRKATCAAKYDTAKTELAKLSPAQQTLFNTNDEFIDARATLAIWEAAKGNLDGAMSVNSSKGKSTTAIVVASVVAVGAISAGAMLFFSRKRKANK